MSVAPVMAADSCSPRVVLPCPVLVFVLVIRIYVTNEDFRVGFEKNIQNIP